MREAHIIQGMNADVMRNKKRLMPGTEGMVSMTKFDIAFNYVIDNEKGLNTDPADRGGITNWGISERFIDSLDSFDKLPWRIGGTPDQAGIVRTIIAYSQKMDFIGNKEKIKIYIRDLHIEDAKWIYQRYFWLPIYD